LRRITDPFSKLVPKNISKKEYPHRCLATTIASVEMTKGKGSPSGEEELHTGRRPSQLRKTNCILESA
jgi:hypothetical protein